MIVYAAIVVLVLMIFGTYADFFGFVAFMTMPLKSKIKIVLAVISPVLFVKYKDVWGHKFEDWFNRTMNPDEYQ